MTPWQAAPLGTHYNSTDGEVSAGLGVTYNRENPDTKVKNGIDPHLGWAASQFLSANWQVGVGRLRVSATQRRQRQRQQGRRVQVARRSAWPRDRLRGQVQWPGGLRRPARLPGVRGTEPRRRVCGLRYAEYSAWRFPQVAMVVQSAKSHFRPNGRRAAGASGCRFGTEQRVPLLFCSWPALRSHITRRSDAPPRRRSGCQSPGRPAGRSQRSHRPALRTRSPGPPTPAAGSTELRAPPVATPPTTLNAAARRTTTGWFWHDDSPMQERPRRVPPAIAR